MTTAKFVRCSQKHTVCVLLLICTQHPCVDQSLKENKIQIRNISHKTFICKKCRSISRHKMEIEKHDYYITKVSSVTYAYYGTLRFVWDSVLTA